MECEQAKAEQRTREPTEREFMDAEAVVANVGALVADFERLCAEFTCPEQARMYGSDSDRNADERHKADCSNSENMNNPKKGSLRVFAQQVGSSAGLNSDGQLHPSTCP